MDNKILIFSNDNVFYLLLSTQIWARNNNIICKKIINISDLEIEDKNSADIIIVDDKIMSISAIELIYELRYSHKFTTAIWLFTIIDIAGYLDKVMEVGANRIIPKPFDPEEIADDIVAFVQKRNLKVINNKMNA